MPKCFLLQILYHGNLRFFKTQLFVVKFRNVFLQKNTALVSIPEPNSPIMSHLSLNGAVFGITLFITPLVLGFDYNFNSVVKTMRFFFFVFKSDVISICKIHRCKIFSNCIIHWEEYRNGSSYPFQKQTTYRMFACLFSLVITFCLVTCLNK